MEEQPLLEKATFEFSQEGNCLSSNDEAEFLQIELVSSLGIDRDDIKPIEHYKGSVVVDASPSGYKNVVIITFKTKDTIFMERIIDFDAQNLKVGDTIK